MAEGGSNWREQSGVRGKLSKRIYLLQSRSLTPPRARLQEAKPGLRGSVLLLLQSRGEHSGAHNKRPEKPSGVSGQFRAQGVMGSKVALSSK